MARHLLIIGHGYVGSRLAETLSANGDRVTVANRGGEDRTSYPVLEADVSDAGSISALATRLDEKPDVVVHCASSSRGGADAYRAVFLDGLDHLRATFPGAGLVFTSSTSVYGQTDGSVVTEKSVTEPDRETSRILVDAERKVVENGGIALRLAGIYGPGRSIYLQRVLEGNAKIETGPGRFLNQVHREDIIGAITHLVDRLPEFPAGRIFNVVDDTPLTQRQCYEWLAGFFGLPAPPEAPPNTGRKRAWTNKVVDNSALKSTGWTLRYPSFPDAVENDPELVPSMRAKVSDETSQS